VVPLPFAVFPALVFIAISVPPPVFPILVIIVVPVPVNLSVTPVARIIATFVVSRSYPIAASIRLTGPVTGVPGVAGAHRIPVARDPRVARTWAWRDISDGGRGRWCVVRRRPDANANRKMRLSE
jgi:hypothetical protein